MRHSPRARGVFSRIRQTASAVIRNHTWRPSGLSSAPYQRVRPLGSRPEARGVRRPGPGAGPATVGPPANRAVRRARPGRSGPRTFVSHRLRLAVSESDQLAVARGSLDGVVAGLLFVAGMRRSEVSALPLVPTSSTRPAGRGQPVSPPLGILCAEPGRGVPCDSLRAWRSTPTPPAVEAAERPAVGSGGCSEEEGLGRGCRRRGPEGGALPEAWTLRASRPRARGRRARRRAVGALRSYARRVFGESEAAVGRLSAAAAGRAGARRRVRPGRPRARPPRRRD